MLDMFIIIIIIIIIVIIMIFSSMYSYVEEHVAVLGVFCVWTLLKEILHV